MIVKCLTYNESYDGGEEEEEKGKEEEEKTCKPMRVGKWKRSRKALAICEWPLIRYSKC